MPVKLHTHRFGDCAMHLAWLSLLCFFGLANHAQAAGPPTPGTHASHSPLNSTFAIADFDGDRKPDLATVEVQRAESSSNTRYSIRFELTAGITQVFGVTAPAGGLQIVARDVNGDDALDLLVSTTWLHQQVAVLLNDGHGKFTLADPGAYPASFDGFETAWKPGALPEMDSSAFVRSSYSPGDFGEKISLEGLQPQAACPNPSSLSGPARLLIVSLRGRAPPRFVH